MRRPPFWSLPIGFWLLVGFLLSGCESPVNLIVHATNLPVATDGIEFLIREVLKPTNGMVSQQLAALSPATRISFADMPPSASDEYTFGIYVDEPPSGGKIQVNVAAISNGCPIATGVNELNPPFDRQNLFVDFHPAESIGSADPTRGCAMGQPQIFAILRTDSQVNGNPEDLRVGVHGWALYPSSSVLLYLDPSGTFTSAPANQPIPFPPVDSDNATELHAVYDDISYPNVISIIKDTFAGKNAIKIAVTNPDGQENTVIFSQL